ncbi:uncharacterized protein BT62DRAFT_921727 [Guyanagaster necrorhizus]|uniref:Uncharacterized protein n=1 Tax=Guyanagaster necrorhizus TaxID=856835 RepID=A0A9P8ARF0_9AGAR|nr:uncharacterized protein BT62DRAFT_921727 [Guyanagaster necrorhizus MCA 3950]KAG7443797.1 hypothetical protein BT62DRAFT_921727 [Guyanagaster necrorhizus MCA 3950]
MTIFIPLLTIPVTTLADNLIGAYAFIATYFDSSVADIIEPQDLIVAVNQATSYLAAYHAGLMHFDLCNSNYSMSFHLELAKPEWKAWALTEVEHKNSLWDYDTSLLLPGEPGYKDENPSSILHQLLLPSCTISALPAPVVIGPTALVPKVVEPKASLSEVLWPIPIRTLQVSREPSFPLVTKNTISIVLSAVSSGSRTTVVHKHQQETGILAPIVPAPASKRAKPILVASSSQSCVQPLVPLFSVSQTTFQWKPIPGSLEFSVPSALSIDHNTSTPSAVESARSAGSSPCSVSTPDPPSEGPEGAPMEAVPSALDSPLSLSPHAYHPLTEMTVLVASEKPPHSQCMQQSILTVSKAPANMTFHESPSCQALEFMKLSMLPVAPDSLTNGQEYVYHCHSDKNPYFIHSPLLSWPCFNCTLAGFPEECIFESGVGKEICICCKSTCHCHCSACWDANQLHHAATLLDPLILSGDGAIHHGIDHIKCIEIKIKLLIRSLQLLYEDWQQVDASIDGDAMVSSSDTE